MSPFDFNNGFANIIIFLRSGKNLITKVAFVTVGFKFQSCCYLKPLGTAIKTQFKAPQLEPNNIIIRLLQPIGGSSRGARELITDMVELGTGFST